MIKKIYLFSAITIMLVVIASSAYCTDWLYFIESGAGDKHYIDMDSLKRSPESIVSVMRKVESGNSSKLAYVISDIEMDCEKVKIRKLSEKAYGPDGLTTSTQSNSDWQAINPEGIDESLYELACSLKKKRSQ
jgi:hypothetical protein